ncbi:hypothetical protein [Aeromicrobium sp. CTD01-1L150]|uniref:hypothetical protein n=1 Tax=Aeromicrobium sp. CTD01-1L150 TaxID=3341830 RepID=UPI0035C158B6
MNLQDPLEGTWSPRPVSLHHAATSDVGVVTTRSTPVTADGEAPTTMRAFTTGSEEG